MVVVGRHAMEVEGGAAFHKHLLEGGQLVDSPVADVQTKVALQPEHQPAEHHRAPMGLEVAVCLSGESASSQAVLAVAVQLAHDRPM